MYHDRAIYLAKRPVRNKLFGNLVGPVPPKDTTHRLTYGKKKILREKRS